MQRWKLTRVINTSYRSARVTDRLGSMSGDWCVTSHPHKMHCHTYWFPEHCSTPLDYMLTTSDFLWMRKECKCICRLHSWTRATTGQERLSSLAQIHIHHDMPVDVDKVVMQAYIVCTYGSTKNGARQFTVILDSIDSQSMSDWSYRLNSDCQWTLCLLSDYDYNGLLLIKLLTHALMHSYDKLFSRTFFS